MTIGKEEDNMKMYIKFNEALQKWVVVQNGIIISNSKTFKKAQDIYKKEREKKYMEEKDANI